MGVGRGNLAALGGLVIAELAGSVYMYRRTMIRCPGKANNKRTIKMSGTDWDRYMLVIEERKERFLTHSREDVYLNSEDGLRLHATYFPEGDQKKVVICFHGYTSQGMKDYIPCRIFI